MKSKKKLMPTCSRLFSYLILTLATGLFSSLSVFAASTTSATKSESTQKSKHKPSSIANQPVTFKYVTTKAGLRELVFSDGRVATLMNHLFTGNIGFNLNMTEDTCKQPETIPVTCHIAVPFSYNNISFVWTKTPIKKQLHKPISIRQASDPNKNDANQILAIDFKTMFAGVGRKLSKPPTLQCNDYAWLGSPDKSGNLHVPLWTAQEMNQNFETGANNNSTDIEIEDVTLVKVGKNLKLVSFGNDLSVGQGTGAQLPFYGSVNSVVRKDGSSYCQLTFASGLDAASNKLASQISGNNQFSTVFIPNLAIERSIDSSIHNELQAGPVIAE